MAILTTILFCGKRLRGSIPFAITRRRGMGLGDGAGCRWMIEDWEKSRGGLLNG